MVFSSLFFIYVFLPTCLVAYFLSPTLAIKNYTLLFASIVFYALGEPLYIVIIFIASFSAFGFAKLIDKHRGTARSKIFFIISVVINVSFLLVFKYVPLFIETANTLFNLEMNVPRIPLPIGISFYTFQILTYTIDIYFGKTPIQKSITNFLLYVTMFPQLIAGPIVRYNDIEEQLTKRDITVEKFATGVMIFACGLGKKVIIADYAGNLADRLLLDANPSTVGVWVGILMYTFQIYYDFSGYSDMAIGLGKMFGFEFIINFNYPYSSKSITEFWRRWHMSLGTFFKDYVYIPLGGNRKHQMRNIAIVWMLTGFWHGASWNFALWGAYFGFILIIEKYIFHKINLKLPTIVQWFYSFFAVVVGWVIFYYTDMSKMATTFGAMFSYKPAEDFQIGLTANENIVFLCLCLFASMPFAKTLCQSIFAYIKRKSVIVGGVIETVLSASYVLIVLCVCTIISIGSSFSPFLYFRF